VHSKRNAGVHQSQTRSRCCRKGKVCYEDEGLPSQSSCTGCGERGSICHEDEGCSRHQEYPCDVYRYGDADKGPGGTTEVQKTSLQDQDYHGLYPGYNCANVQGDRYGNESQAFPISRNSDGHSHEDQALSVPCEGDMYGYRDFNKNTGGTGYLSSKTMSTIDGHGLYTSHCCANVQGDRHCDEGQALSISSNRDGYNHEGQALSVPSEGDVYGHGNCDENTSGTGYLSSKALFAFDSHRLYSRRQNKSLRADRNRYSACHQDEISQPSPHNDQVHEMHGHRNRYPHVHPQQALYRLMPPQDLDSDSHCHKDHAMRRNGNVPSPSPISIPGSPTVHNDPGNSCPLSGSVSVQRSSLSSPSAL
jgi:hypothetical protein